MNSLLSPATPGSSPSTSPSPSPSSCRPPHSTSPSPSKATPSRRCRPPLWHTRWTHSVHLTARAGCWLHPSKLTGWVATPSVATPGPRTKVYWSHYSNPHKLWYKRSSHLGSKHPYTFHHLVWVRKIVRLLEERHIMLMILLLLLL